jgi:hypothetical protein
VLRIALKIDTRGPAAGLAATRRIELVDPSRNAVHGFIGEDAGQGHSCAAVRRPAKLHDQQRAIAIAGDDARFSTAKCGGATKELELQCASLQVESSCAVVRAMTAGIDATRPKDLA